MIREGQKGFDKKRAGKDQVKVHPCDDSVIDDRGALSQAETVMASEREQRSLWVPSIQDKQAMLIDQVQEVAASASGLL